MYTTKEDTSGRRPEMLCKKNAFLLKILPKHLQIENKATLQTTSTCTSN